MQKGSLLFWLIILGVMLISAYESFFVLPASTIMIRAMGLIAFYLLSVSLAIGPLATIWPPIFGAWVEPRRAVGLSAFAFMAGHYFLVLIHRFDGDFSGSFSSFSYIIAIPAMVVFTLLALTSTDVALRKIGFGKWKFIQRLTYVGFLFAAAHYYFSQTGVIVVLANGGAFFNLAEAGVWAVAGFAVVMQLVGFFVMRAKKKAAAATRTTPAAAGNEQH